jgi:hypothetical protein
MQFFNSPNTRIQCLVGDDNTIEFRRLHVKDASLKEKDGDTVTRAWPFFHKLLFRFEGGHGLPAGMVLLSCDRDIILDPFNKLIEDEKPEKGHELNKEWIQRIAETQRYKHQRKPANNWMASKVTMFMGAALIIMSLMIGLKLAI